jgi:O-antigen ligase
VSPGALVLAAAIPVLFLHVHYQPGLALGFGSTTIDAYLSDFAVLAVVVAAAVVVARGGGRRLAHGIPLWVVGALFFTWLAIEIAHGRVHAGSYDWHKHLVTGAKFAEYALLAPAAVVLVRVRGDLLAVLWSLALWCAFASGVGVAQFFGARIFLAGTAGRRQASFLSSADFAALAGAVLVVGALALAVPRLGLGRWLATVATASGAIGVVVAGAMASILGLGLALVAVVVVLGLRRELDLRRGALVLGVGAAVLLGAIAIRGSDLEHFARFAGVAPRHNHERASHVQTYAHRTLLAWLGYRIWESSPAIGVGWEGSAEPANFVPYLPAAHRRFPTEAPQAFPSAAPDRRYGVQNSWLQALADLGLVGFMLWVALFALAGALAVRVALARGNATALVGLGWIGLLAGLWTAQGFVAGIPLDAVTWLGLGFAVSPAFEQQGLEQRMPERA